MLLRICLILTIVAGLATAYLAFFPVKEIIQTTRDARDDFHNKLTAETTAHNKTKKELATTKANLEKTTAELTQTKTDLEAANTKNTELDKQNADLTDKLTKMTARADDDEARLEQWRLLPAPEAIRGMMKDLEQARKTIATYTKENRILAANLRDLQAKWDNIFGSDVPPPMPTGLKGTVLAVDPKYDFVVLNIGDDQGAKQRGELMVERQGKLIGKVRISSVEKDRCVATIMPAWKRGQIMEGDVVLY